MTTSNSKATGIFNQVMGLQTELTIRGERDFTVSFDGENKEAVAKLKKYLGNTVVYDTTYPEYDEECEMTAIFFTVK